MNSKAEKFETQLDEVVKTTIDAYEDLYQDPVVPWSARVEEYQKLLKDSILDFRERFPKGYALMREAIRQRREKDNWPESDDYIISKEANAILDDEERFKAILATGTLVQGVLEFTDEVMEEYYYEACQIYESGAYDDAICAFLFLTNVNPMISKHWLGLGHAYRKEREFDKALEALKWAVTFNPIEIEPYCHYVKCAIQAGEFGKAVAVIDIAKQIADTEDPPIEQLRSDALELMKYVESEEKGS